MKRFSIAAGLFHADLGRDIGLGEAGPEGRRPIGRGQAAPIARPPEEVQPPLLLQAVFDAWQEPPEG